MKDDDELINVFLTDGQADVIMGTNLAILFDFAETDVRNMGRTATGVRGIKLREGDHLVSATIVSDDQEVLVLSEKGYGKRTSTSEYPTGRGGKGIITLKVADKMALLLV